MCLKKQKFENNIDKYNNNRNDNNNRQHGVLIIEYISETIPNTLHLLFQLVI